MEFLHRRPSSHEVERGGRDGEATSELDEEMEKMFQRDDDKRVDERLAHISESSPTRERPLTDQDLVSHRNSNYPHTYIPLKTLHSKRKKIHSPKSPSEAPDKAGKSKQDDSHTPTNAVKSEADVSAGEDDITHATRPLMSASSEVVMDPFLFPAGSRDRRVQLDPGSPEPDEMKRDLPLIIVTAENDDSDETRRDQFKKKKRRHHHRKDNLLLEDPVWRKRSGDEASQARRMSEAVLEETRSLQEIDQDDLLSRRFDIPKGKRHYSVRPNKESRKESTSIEQKKYDHSPHEVFVQLDELSGVGPDQEWKETARWIKYEENVEEGAERWGKPHVAPLSFHSLLNLRKCLEIGVILVDLEEKDLIGIVFRIVEQMATDELISEFEKPMVMRALLLRHKCFQGHERFKFSVRRNHSSYSSLQNFSDETKKVKIVPSASAADTTKVNFLAPPNANPNHTTVDMKEETYASSTEDLARRAVNESILKRIPVGAEATTVFVGAAEFLEFPTIAFVRLAEGTLLPGVTEVPIPVRFIFTLLGPSSADVDYHEVGRSISTLMSSPDFHDIAYKAASRKELLSAINDFLDSSIVLPPGDWERKSLLPFNELRAKTEAIRRRQSRSSSTLPAAKKALIASGGDDRDDEFKKEDKDDPLRRTRKPWGGLMKDIKRRYQFYLSDFTDGFNGQCIAAAIFMYFAALSGTITFGGLMGDKTNNLIGISETLVSSAWAGILFALLSGQPLVIIGTTGPLLLFDDSLYSFCLTSEIDFLAMRVYITFWLFIISLMVSFFEGSVLVKLFSRFTEEIFASLVSLLFIVESVIKICKVFQKNPIMTLNEYCHAVNASECLHGYATPPPALSLTDNSSALSAIDNVNLSTTPTPYATSEKFLYANTTTLAGTLTSHKSSLPGNEPNTALFCMILSLGTFFIAYYLRHFRNSKFLGRSARRALGDFGVPIAIILMVALDYAAPGIYTEKLKVPEGMNPSDSDVRGWIIPLGGLLRPLPVWCCFATFIPAILLYILLFMETHIAELIIAKKERKLKKGSGFHLDIVLMCLLNVGCGLMGAPFICAATVRSVTHVAAVTVMSRTHAPGDKPHIIEVKEQRVSALVVATLIGLSVLIAPLLRLVPMAVLFGVFLYMGVSSINGIQLFERCRLFFMPVKHHPQVSYVRRVQTLKMHLFTFIQLLCLALLWTVKSSGISLAFPFFLILMVPLRSQLSLIFSPLELRALDGDDQGSGDGNDEEEPDFYVEALLPG